jgi:hypothetical protein
MWVAFLWSNPPGDTTTMIRPGPAAETVEPAERGSAAGCERVGLENGYLGLGCDEHQKNLR